MTNANHTPGPWEHGDNGLIYGQCGEDDVEAPFVCDVIEDSAMQALGMLSPVEEANARRICAAVNACKGITTEALEQNAVQALLEAAEVAWRRAANHEKLTLQECNQLYAALFAARVESVSQLIDRPKRPPEAV